MDATSAGKALLAELLDWATQPRFCYRHGWGEGGRGGPRQRQHAASRSAVAGGAIQTDAASRDNCRDETRGRRQGTPAVNVRAANGRPKNLHSKMQYGRLPAAERNSLIGAVQSSVSAIRIDPFGL